LYAQGWTLRQIGAELSVDWRTVSQRLQSAGVTMRRSAPPAHPASTQQILELRDRGMTWNEIAKQADMTGCLEPLPEGPATKVPTLRAVGRGFSPTRLTRTLRLAFEQPPRIGRATSGAAVLLPQTR
jgi:hypothetical protein